MGCCRAVWSPQNRSQYSEAPLYRRPLEQQGTSFWSSPGAEKRYWQFDQCQQWVVRLVLSVETRYRLHITAERFICPTPGADSCPAAGRATEPTLCPRTGPIHGCSPKQKPKGAKRGAQRRKAGSNSGPKKTKKRNHRTLSSLGGRLPTAVVGCAFSI
jgi:hypothetical protein